jgi:putative sigma-54 modulation protein
MNLSDKLKERTISKLDRLGKLISENADVYVTFSVVKLENKIEVTIPLQKRILRAEVADTDMYNAIDSVVDILEKQMVKYKNRLRDKSRKNSSYKEELSVYPTAEELSYDEGSMHKIERTKKFALKPMDADEAVMEMELLGHSFYVFKNGETDEVNVVYKRNNGSYGLIEPEY